MQQYKQLVERILKNGKLKPTRAKLASTGKNVDALSIFGYQMRFDLREGFPILTTKKMPFRAIGHELIWFLRGNTNIAYLKDNGVKIWDEWADTNGDIGPVYPALWRRWNETGMPYVINQVDQIQKLIDDINEVKKNPLASCGRRLMLTAWNPSVLHLQKLPCCHVLAQFDVADGRLSCQMYQRSADTFLGVPFNISSYALLTHILAHVTGLHVGEFVHTFGDVHIYTNHIEVIKEQIKREPKNLPPLKISDSLTDINKIKIDDFELIGYDPHPQLKGEVAI